MPNHDAELRPQRERWSRRSMVKLTAAGLVGTLFGGLSTAMLTRLWRKSAGKYQFLSESEGGLLNEICEQLVPRDATPGAADSGAVDYIDRQLSGFFARHRQTYRRGLEAFQRTCLQVFKQPFQQLGPAEKIEALRAIESGRAAKDHWSGPEQQAFFELVLGHSLQGFYGSPRHGGNRDYASYRMLGLDYPQVVGQNRYPEVER